MVKASSVHSFMLAEAVTVPPATGVPFAVVAHATVPTTDEVNVARTVVAPRRVNVRPVIAGAVGVPTVTVSKVYSTFPIVRFSAETENEPDCAVTPAIVKTPLSDFHVVADPL